MTTEKIREKKQIQFFCVTTRAMTGWNLEQMGEFVGVSGEAVRTWELGKAVPAADSFMRILSLRKDIVRAKKRGKRFVQSMRDASGNWRGVPAEVA